MHLEELKCRVNTVFYAEDSYSILSRYFTQKYFSSLRSCPDFPYFSSGEKIKQTKPEKKNTSSSSSEGIPTHITKEEMWVLPLKTLTAFLISAIFRKCEQWGVQVIKFAVFLLFIHLMGNYEEMEGGINAFLKKIDPKFHPGYLFIGL